LQNANNSARSGGQRGGGIIVVNLATVVIEDVILNIRYYFIVAHGHPLSGVFVWGKK
jgi:hypothetical protein